MWEMVEFAILKLVLKNYVIYGSTQWRVFQQNFKTNIELANLSICTIHTILFFWLKIISLIPTQDMSYFWLAEGNYCSWRSYLTSPIFP